MRLNNTLRIAAVLVVATSAFAAYKVQTVPVMVKAANNLLVTLSPEQKAKLQYEFTSRERMNFHFTPGPWDGVGRMGLPLREMRPEQVKLAHALLASGVSQAGYIKASTIMSLEQILKETEGPNGRFNRDPDGYFFTVFGEPSEKGMWGFRVEGHHLTLNFTMNEGKVVADTPTFMGANPAEVRQGPRTGLRVLGREEDLGRQLVTSLDARQRAVAVIDARAPGDIRTGENLDISAIPDLDLHKPTGIQASKLTSQQAEILVALVEEYAYRMPVELAEATMAEIRKPGLDKIYFSWAGGLDKGELHYYRVHGQSFLIEFNNTQNQGNHVHSVWRDLKNDFGQDLLKEHLKTAHAH